MPGMVNPMGMGMNSELMAKMGNRKKEDSFESKPESSETPAAAQGRHPRNHIIV